MTTVGAVVGHHNEVIGDLFELVLQNDNVLAAETDDNGDLRAGFLKSPGRGQSNGAAYAAAHNTDLLLAFHGSRLAQRTHEIVNIVALIQRAQSVGGEANLLEDDGDGACFLVGAGNGQGDSLTHLVNPEDDELTCLSLFGNEGGLNIHQGDGGVQLLLTHNFIHF